MALQITQNLKAQEISLTSMYVRITAEVNSQGTKVKVKADFYNDKPAYTASIYNMLPVKAPYTKTDTTIEDIKIENVREFDYNRLTDGTDLLQFAHDKYSAYLQEIPKDGEGNDLGPLSLILIANIAEADLI